MTLLHLNDAGIVLRALKWAEETWPYDPEAGDLPPTLWPDIDGEVLPPSKLEVRNANGYRVGWIVLTDEGAWAFDHDHEEDR